MTEQVSQRQREAIKTAAKQHHGVQRAIAKKAGIAGPTLSRWLATGHGISDVGVCRVLLAVQELLGISVDRMTENGQISSPFHP